MHRFLPGVILIQIISVVIFWVNIPLELTWDFKLALKILLPLLLLGISTSLWFDSIAKNRAAGTIAKLKERHAKDREKLQLQTERDKSRVVKDAHKEIVREQRRVNNKANMKVGVAFFAAAGAGVIMLITELVTFGMITLMTAGGALSGYFYRGRKETGPDVAVMPERGGEPILINPEVKTTPIRSTDKNR